MENQTTITGIDMISIYAEDYPASFAFYNGLLGLDDYSPMGDFACYFRLPDERGMYLIGKRIRAARPKTEIRTTFCFAVGSASAMFEKLRNAGIECLFEEPMEMGNNYYWFEAVDPSGNIIEFIGKK
ncbi:MAG: VOC family protein [Bacteroidetes bacterium]|nr:VOC family protein [Bacteroidota bacterium]